MGVNDQLDAPGRFTDRQIARYPLYRRLGGPQRQYGSAQEISPSLGFDPQVVQPVASRRTDYGIPAHI
jgi:hypothetical protein